ncbi:MAG: chemotaxis protein CheW [Cellvibrionaceae bacterium]|nr:chemotaxis protein CheW [Cellvibrionaceae bacterium]
MSEEQTAFNALINLAHKSLNSAQPLPEQRNAVAQWTGIGFSLFGVDLVAPMGSLAEMIEVPAYTKLPGVQPWVKGIASVRGRLLPVYDLAGYFGGSLLKNKKQQRLLVIDRDQTYAGLWVDQVFGMQYFPVDTKSEVLPPNFPDALKPFIETSYMLNGRRWMVFHPLGLLNDARFIDVALN